jgi:hypothetical protein
MFKKFYLIALFLPVGLSATPGRNFSGEYSKARELILKSCEAASQKCALTDLHRAVLQGDVSQIKQLVEQGAQLDAPAKHRWTAAHFASLHEDSVILDLLFELDASKKSLDVNKGTPEDLWKLTHLFEGQKINFWDESSQSVVQISAEEFEKLTGARFVESTKMSPKTLAEQWLQGFKKHPKNVPMAIQRIPKFQDGVYIKKMPGNIGYGIYALRAFKANEVIGEYQGEWVGELIKEDAEYSTQNINGAHLRGYVPFSAHGFPNAALEPISQQKGMSANEILIAKTAIRPHQPIMWNYGTHDIVWKVYQEQLPDVLDRYILRHGLGLQSNNPQANHEQHINILTYVLTTPTVFIRLLLENKIPKYDLELIFNQNLMARATAQTSQAGSFIDLESRIRKSLAYLEKMDSQSRQNVFQFLASKAREGNQQIIAQVLGNIEALCEESVQNSWGSLLGLQEHSVCSYEKIEKFWLKMWLLFCDKYKDSPMADCKSLYPLLVGKTTADL